MNPNLFVRQGTAFALGGHLEGPVPGIIEPQACLSLAGIGSSSLIEVSSFNHRGISFQSAQTQVMGMPAGQNERTAVTMLRTSIQGLNILNTITAKAVHVRMIVTTEIPQEEVQGLGDFSTFNFHGTAFDDLRVAGVPFEPSNDPADPSRKGPHPYDEVLEGLEESYRSESRRLVTSLIRSKQAFFGGRARAKDNDANPIHIRDFGELHVAELQYNPYLSCLNMLRLEVNCGAFQGHLEIGAVRGGGSCWPKQGS